MLFRSAKAIRCFSTNSANQPVILSAVRTPIGSFQGALSTVDATDLGALVVRNAVSRSSLQSEDIGECFMGNVVSAGLGQAPARQAALKAGLPESVPCTTVNKVCASGMKSVMFAASSIELGQQQAIVAGGMESMSKVPFYLNKARTGYGYGHGQLTDGLMFDGLTDSFDKHPMGVCGDKCAEQFDISREQQDEFAVTSYTRSAEASKGGLFDNEIVPVEVPGRRGKVTVVDTDEEFTKVKFDKIPSLRPVFDKNGTVTAANASTLNDGASAMVISSAGYAAEKGAKPLATILGYADAARKPLEFPIAPSDAIPLALKRAGVSQEEVDFFEINEAFSVVALANSKVLDIPLEKLNVNGGGVSLGHPIGSSGSRIIVSLINILKQRNAKIGVAAICNGGGGASAIVIRNEQ